MTSRRAWLRNGILPGECGHSQTPSPFPDYWEALSLTAHANPADPMSAFFTSDTHFGHARVIETCDRPFASADEMDATLIERWNERVRPGDTVYHLGDFCYRASRTAGDYLRQLNGSIHLVVGNHDAEALKFAGRFASVNHILEVTAGGQQIVLCHYPMREWHGSWRGAWHLFGHVHARLNHEPHGYSLDAGVDSHDFRPWAMDEIAAVMALRENPFHEGRRPRPQIRVP